MTKLACPRWPLKLKNRFPDKRTPNYREFYAGVVDGSIPYEVVGSRLFIDEAHEDLVAERFGLLERKRPDDDASSPTTNIAA